MPCQIATFRSVAFAVLLLLWDSGIGVPARADDCLTAPGSSTPQGSHWYYRTDRAKGQKCWYLRPLGEPAQQPAAQDESAPAVHTGAVETPATKFTPTLTEAGDSAPAVPPPKVQPPSTSDATTQEPVEQPIQGESVVSSSLETPASPASVPWRILVPAPAPSATAIWPNSPPAPPADLTPSNVRPVSVPPIVDTRASHNSKNAVSVAPITLAAKMGSFPTGTLAEILLAVAIGLMAVGLLYRIIMKIFGTGSQRITIRHSDPEWIGDRIWRALRRNHQQHRSVDARNEFTGKCHARENKYAQLIQEFDQFVQSSKQA